MRSGADDSQQFAHITIIDFDDNSTGDADFNFDKWYFKYNVGNAEFRLGRDSLPFWRPDELTLDNDVTFAGLGFTYETESLMLNAGYFSNPAGMRDFSGNSAVAQVVFSMPVGEANLMLAGGVIDIDADPDNTANMLFLDGNGARDYTIWVGSVQTGLEALDRPLVLNLDLIHNSKNYSRTDLDAFTAFHRNERDGYVVSARLGDTGERGQWQLGYFYAYIETLAVNNSYAEDDWLRWGSATQTRASNFKGSEFRATWGLGTNMNLVARLFVVKGIELRSATATDKEDGTRFRFDFNWKS